MGTQSSPKITGSMAQAWIDQGAASVDNLLVRWERLSPHDIELGCNWYPWAKDLCQSLAYHWNQPVETVIALTAVLSANTAWPINQRLVVSYLESHATGNPPVKRSLFAGPKALALLSGAEPEDIVGGPKITAFWQSILSRGECNRACLDRWAVRSLFPDGEWVNYFTANHALVPASYAKLEPLYLQAAAQVGLPGPKFQACLWGEVRGSLV